MEIIEEKKMHAIKRHSPVGKKQRIKASPERQHDRLFRSAEGNCLTEASTARLKQHRKNWRPCTIAGMDTHAVRVKVVCLPSADEADKRTSVEEREYLVSVKTGGLYDTKTRRNLDSDLRIKWRK